MASGPAGAVPALLLEPYATPTVSVFIIDHTAAVFGIGI